MARSRSIRRALLASAFVAAAGLAGCYRHVVGVKGPGASTYDVYEPHYQPQEEEQIKSFFGGLFGQKKSDKSP